MLPGGPETHAAEVRWPLTSSLGRVWTVVLCPLLVYCLVFTVFTFPVIKLFSSHFFADTRDGLQNVWNIWWVNKSVTELHQLPWHTHLLHYPYGISLLPQTLNPFNGFMAIPLLRIMSLEQVYNLIVIFSFIVGGLTAFLLAYRFTAAYWPSIVAGFIFTFSNFHFAHAQGHLQLVSLEWIPLFVLLWYSLLETPRIWTGVGASAALFFGGPLRLLLLLLLRVDGRADRLLADLPPRHRVLAQRARPSAGGLRGRLSGELRAPSRLVAVAGLSRPAPGCA
jgi:hypothetical protein